MCYCFVAAVTGTLPCMDSTRLVVMLTVRSALEINQVAQCNGYNFPATWLKQ